MLVPVSHAVVEMKDALENIREQLEMWSNIDMGIIAISGKSGCGIQPCCIWLLKTWL